MAKQPARRRKRITPKSNAPASQPAGALSGFAKLDAWREAHAGPFFPTRTSLEWFIRHHRAELVASGALILGEGRSGSVVECARFAAQVVEIKRRESQDRVG